jgi:hypothetical protein
MICGIRAVLVGAIVIVPPLFIYSFHFSLKLCLHKTEMRGRERGERKRGTGKNCKEVWGGVEMKEIVCVCVCVCLRERERERECV